MNFTIRKIILGIVPHGVIRFFKKKANFNYLFFGAARKDIGQYLVNTNEKEFTLYGMEKVLGVKVVGGFQTCFESYRSHPGFLRKYILEVKDCVIEPKYGWAIQRQTNKLVFDSVSNNSWLEAYHPDYFQYKNAKSRTIKLSSIVSINLLKGGENNYWHFLHDLLGQVALAQKLLPHDIPYLISKALSEKAYFKQALKRSKQLSTIRWLVRENEYYHAEQAWFLQTLPNSNEQFLAVRDLLEVPVADPANNRKVFLTRSEKRIRFLSNKAEIETLAVKHGFEIVDADYLNLDEQIDLFNSTSVLVGIHGAGLTNMIFRKGETLHLLELLPADYLQPHYFWLAKGMGHAYSGLVGTQSAINTSFHIDPVQFEAKIKELL